jgi:hypothetical protein
MRRFPNGYTKKPPPSFSIARSSAQKAVEAGEMRAGSDIATTAEAIEIRLCGQI